LLTRKVGNLGLKQEVQKEIFKMKIVYSKDDKYFNVIYITKYVNQNREQQEGGCFGNVSRTKKMYTGGR